MILSLDVLNIIKIITNISELDISTISFTYTDSMYELELNK